MKGIILAAGRGTRMLPLTERRPKPLVPVLDRPMIEHIITGARDAGFDDLCLVVGHLGQLIEERFGDGADLGVRLTYAWQDTPGGTGHATLLARDFVGDEPFFLSWGDIIVPPAHYRRVADLYRTRRPDAVLSLNVVDDPWEGAAVYVRDGLVERIIEKPPRGASTTNYNNAGVFVFGPELMELLEHTPPSARGEVEVPDAVQQMLAQGAEIAGVEVAGYWSDVARPATILELNAAMIQYQGPEGVLVDPSAKVSDRARLVPPVYVGLGCSVGEAQVGPNVTLSEGVQVKDGACLRDLAAFGGNTVGEGAVAQSVIVEEEAMLPPDQSLAGSGTGPAIVSRV